LNTLDGIKARLFGLLRSSGTELRSHVSMGFANRVVLFASDN
jgi:hypothetical protein